MSLRRLSTVVLSVLLALVAVPAAGAHPLGNFTINQYTGLHLHPDTLTLDYVVDMAEIAAFQEIAALDRNGNRQPDPDEAAAYHAARCAALGPDLVVRVGGAPLTLSLASSSVEFPAGAGGLLTLRLTCELRAAWTASDQAVEFTNTAFPNRLGWREIVVTGEGVAVRGDFATASRSGRLTAYPDDLLNSPLDQRTVSLTVAPLDGAASPSAQATPVAANNAATRDDALTRLAATPELTWPVALAALVVALVWGALHALTPGHGKTIVGAYLVGSRGTARHALYLGLATTLTHTAGVFTLGLITLFAAEYILPERLFPWLSLASGLLVVGIGVNLLAGRLRAFLGRRHDHDHGHVHQSGRDHDHDHTHDHDHGHVLGHAHTHGGQGHSHLPPGADGAPVTWRSLLALGISGGLLPCPSALVVLLSAIALDRVAFGLVLVLTFSLGLAGTLTAIGLILVYAGRLFQRLPAHSRLVGLVSAGSAAFITVAGLAIAGQALVQIGWIKL